MEILEKFMPNVVKYFDKITTAVYETIAMVFISLVFIIIFGTILGLILVVISPGHLYENKVLNNILPKLINIMRSIPFVLVIALLLPVTRFLVGTAIGIRGAVVPIVISMIPFVARQVEVSVLEVPRGVIEMSLSLGLSKPYIIFRVLLKEGVQGIIRSLTLSSISLVAASTIAGVVGGGGVGDLALRYGYARFMTDMTVVTIVLLLILVFVIQTIGNFLMKRVTH
ncbi:ABC transporter permease [Clostridia bacterium]|nr:ABC transporter permease [Clostridia bacterium]